MNGKFAMSKRGKVALIIFAPLDPRQFQRPLHRAGQEPREAARRSLSMLNVLRWETLLLSPAVQSSPSGPIARPEKEAAASCDLAAWTELVAHCRGSVRAARRRAFSSLRRLWTARHRAVL